MTTTVLTPTGTLGYGFGGEAFERALGLGVDAIAVDAGSTDPGPHYLGSGEPLVSHHSTRRELEQLLLAARARGVPLIVGSAAGSGARPHVDATLDIVRALAREHKLRFKLASIHADVPAERVKRALHRGEVRDFEAGVPLDEAAVDASVALVAQMGHEPIVAALEAGADVVITGRACDESVIAAVPIARGAEPGLAIHMGKILECGAFSAEPFAMDVMVGRVERDGFVLEPGSTERRASLISVAAHSLYERENPFLQHGPGYAVDMSACRYDQLDERRVRVSGARFLPSDEVWVKLEGVRRVGFRTICIAGVRCPTMLPRLDGLLERARAESEAYFAPERFRLTFHRYGRDGVMRGFEPVKEPRAPEVGLVIDVVAAEQALARAVCHHISGKLLHIGYEGQKNTSGNLAFPYSPSEIDAGPVHRFSVYHLMRVDSATELFRTRFEEP